MQQEIEIEKRFLVDEDSFSKLEEFIKKDSKVTMKDVYVPNGDQHKNLRLRSKGGAYMVTRKRPVKKGNVLTMVENTIEISKEEFLELASGIETTVEKDRYIIEFAGRTGEIDVFTNRHDGLIILEFEFDDVSEVEEFDKNTKVDLIDITDIEWLACGRLADIDNKTLKQKLEKLSS